MIHLALPDDIATQELKLPFFLAMEEYAARFLSGSYFFMWQVKPTVIYGRNQIPESEFNIDYCRKNNIEFYRRKSGGGCVYADANNVMFSHITDCNEVSSTFSSFTSAVAGMLRELGIDSASATGRNDILIGDRKVSGYAFYHVKSLTAAKSRAIVHGTMLYDTDTDTMTAVLTPSATKLAAKGVASVRQRVTNIKEHSGISLPDFKRHALECLCSGTMTLTHDQIDGIRLIEKDYYSQQWLFGKYTDGRRHNSTRIPGVGEISVKLKTSAIGRSDSPADCLIDSIELSGDYFSDASAVQQMLQRVRGTKIDRCALAEAFSNAGLADAIPGLAPAEMAQLVIGELEMQRSEDSSATISAPFEQS